MPRQQLVSFRGGESSNVTVIEGKEVKLACEVEGNLRNKTVSFKFRGKKEWPFFPRRRDLFQRQEKNFCRRRTSSITLLSPKKAKGEAGERA